MSDALVPYEVQSIQIQERRRQIEEKLRYAQELMEERQRTKDLEEKDTQIGLQISIALKKLKLEQVQQMQYDALTRGLSSVGNNDSDLRQRVDNIDRKMDAIIAALDKPRRGSPL